MLDVSWGEMMLVIGVGMALLGRKDLPTASRLVGTQVGRIVGLLQGARARMDQVASQQIELQQLQQQVRSGLQQLEAVQSELAVSLSARTNSHPGMMLGRQALGTTKLVSANTQGLMTPSNINPSSPSSSLVSPTIPAPLQPSSGQGPLVATDSASSSSTGAPATTFSDESMAEPLPAPALSPVSSAYQSMAAVVEDEWIKRGMSYQSKGEQGVALGTSYDASSAGSVLLNQILQQSLVFDQYDRVVQQQDQILQSKVEQIKLKHQATAQHSTNPKKKTVSSSTTKKDGTPTKR